ncbi:TrbM/KikA/MpfK family conjugal transfer protein [Gilliamella sp. BG7]|uniref:TrbM/KikA/MpfK family conjugal transfer protein n=1 Tax=unclassified Gilliamella TaxID=2685620 RepID=UPI003986F294
MKIFSKSCLFLLTLYCFSSQSFANELLKEPSINKDDPCTVFLCMAGKVKGENPSECSSPVKKFFSIVSKKHGKFNGGRTSNARGGFLGQCPSADPSMINKIVSKFGTLRH